MKAQNLTELIKASKKKEKWFGTTVQTELAHDIKQDNPSELLDEAIYDYLKTLNLLNGLGLRNMMKSLF